MRASALLRDLLDSNLHQIEVVLNGLPHLVFRLRVDAEPTLINKWVRIPFLAVALGVLDPRRVLGLALWYDSREGLDLVSVAPVHFGRRIRSLSHLNGKSVFFHTQSHSRSPLLSTEVLVGRHWETQSPTKILGGISRTHETSACPSWRPNWSHCGRHSLAPNKGLASHKRRVVSLLWRKGAVSSHLL